MPAAEKTVDLVVLRDEYKAGWRFVQSWNPETNEITLEVSGKLEQNPCNLTQTATFVVPSEMAAEIWEHPFRHREHMTGWVEHPAAGD